MSEQVLCTIIGSITTIVIALITRKSDSKGDKDVANAPGPKSRPGFVSKVALGLAITALLVGILPWILRKEPATSRAEVAQWVADEMKQELNADENATSGGCAHFGDIKLCWGQLEAKPHGDPTMKPDILAKSRDFGFQFPGKPFIETPTITSSLHTLGGQGSPDWVIYQSTLSKTNYAGNIIAKFPEDAAAGKSISAYPVYVHYVAVGRWK